jgi:AcrR family transcriptional regulator
MPPRRGEVAKRRRDEIVNAAIAIITDRGLPKLSLSAIEKRARMSRGQLTYYFKTKEDILLAVFDRMIEVMRSREQAGEMSNGVKLPPRGWERLKMFLTLILVDPPPMPGFHALHHTFLSQISHREDFRQRIAALHEGWRQAVSRDMAREIPDPEQARVFATLFQALIHGLAIQREANPQAYDPQRMAQVCVQLLHSFILMQSIPPKWPPTAIRRASRRTSKAGEK